jgi:hypothetical protein
MSKRTGYCGIGMSTPSVGAVMSMLMSSETPADALAMRKMSSGVAWWASQGEMGNEVSKGKEGNKGREGGEDEIRRAHALRSLRRGTQQQKGLRQTQRKENGRLQAAVTPDLPPRSCVPHSLIVESQYHRDPIFVCV